MVDAVPKELCPRVALLYSHTGRPTSVPQQLLSARLLEGEVSWVPFIQVLGQARERGLLKGVLKPSLGILLQWEPPISYDDYATLLGSDSYKGLNQTT
jgi:hypothetical protein